MKQNSEVVRDFVYGRSVVSKSKNLTYSGDTIYSYKEPLAIKVGEDVFLFSDYIGNYSSTSKKHASLVLREIPVSALIIKFESLKWIGGIEDIGESDIQYLIDNLNNLILLQERARVKNYLPKIKNIYRGIKLLNANFDAREEIKKRMEDIESTRGEIEERILKGEFDKKIHNALKFGITKEELDLHTREEIVKNNFIKVVGDDIVTNFGVKIPLILCKHFLLAYKAGEDIIEEKIGGYRITSIKDGTATIGCHTLNIGHLERVVL